MMPISATSESRIRSDCRFCAITASNRRFSIRTASRFDWSTRSRVLSVMKSSRPPPITTTAEALAAMSHGFLMLAISPRKSGSASLKPKPLPQPARGAGRGLEERRCPLHPHRQLLGPRLHVGREIPALRQALDQPLRILGGEPLLPLQVLAEAPRAHRQVPRQD